MKKLIIFFVCISFATVAQTRYVLSSGINKIAWAGGKSFNGHTGTMNLVSGYVMVDKNGVISKGDFQIDVKSLHNDANKGKVTATGFSMSTDPDMLEEHLRGPDFFETDKYPTASFVIGSATKTTTAIPDQFMVVGLLTMKNITNSIRFPAIVKVAGDNVFVKAEIVFDRTKWDIVYKAEGFFNGVKNELIANDIRVTLDLRLPKAQ